MKLKDFDHARYRELASVRHELALWFPDATRLKVLLEQICTEGMGWHIAASGFYKMQLWAGPTFHLHVWDENRAWVNQYPHVHPFAVRSRILKGAIHNRTFDATVSDDGAHHEARVNCRTRATTWHQATLTPRATVTVRAGETYHVDTQTIHVAKPDPGTVTLVEKGEFVASAEGRVYIPMDDTRDRTESLGLFLDWRDLEPGELDHLRSLASSG